MKNQTPTLADGSDTQEIAELLNIELTILLSTEQSLRTALQWMTRTRGNGHKLSTLRFHTWSFERHLTRIHALADHGGYLHRITDANPHLSSRVDGLKKEQTVLRDALEAIVMRLEFVSRDDAEAFAEVCKDLERLLDDLRRHGQQECELLQHSLMQEQGGSG